MWVGNLAGYLLFFPILRVLSNKTASPTEAYSSAVPQTQARTTPTIKTGAGACHDVSTNVKLQGCPTHFNLFLAILLDPAEDVMSYWNFISSIITPCINAETYSGIQSRINLNMTSDTVTLDMRDVSGHKYEAFYINYTTLFDSNKYIIKKLVQKASQKEDGFQNVIYLVTNIKCSKITDQTYPYLQSELHVFAQTYLQSISDVPFRFFWTNEVQQNFGCGLDGLADITAGMADVVPGSLNTKSIGSQFGMCAKSPTTTTTTTTPRTSDGSLKWFAYIGIVLVSVITIIVGFFIMRRLFCRMWTPWQRCADRIIRSYVKNSEAHNDEVIVTEPGFVKTVGNEYKDHASNDRMTSDKWELQPSNLHISKEKLGSGAYAVVYKGTLKGVPPVVNVFPRMQLNYILSDKLNEVAVKTPPYSSTKEERSEFLREIEFMKQLEYYPYLLSMLACSTDENFPILVTELCELGDLSHLLREMNDTTSMKSKILNVKDLLAISWQISDALAFLSHKKIIHRDVAARNVLLTESKLAKLSDFGLCRYNEEMFYTTRGGKLPIKWMAPESIEFAQFSTKSDVWSFGVLLFESYSFGQTPYAHIQPEEMLEFLKAGKRLEVPQRAPDEIMSIMHRCFVSDPQHRPDFTEIRRKLYRLMESESDTYGYLQFSGQYYHFTPSAEGAFTIVKPENINKNKV